MGNHELRHLAAELSTSSFHTLVNRQHLVPFCPRNPQLLWHKQRHLLKPIITGSTLQSQSLCQRVTVQSRNAEGPDTHLGGQARGPAQWPRIFSHMARAGPLPSKQILLVQEGERRRVTGLDNEAPSPARRPTCSNLHSPPEPRVWWPNLSLLRSGVE